MNHNGDLQNVLITYGSNFLKSSGQLDQIKQMMKEINNSVNIFELNGIRPNPQVQSVIQGCQIINDNTQITSILAIGGGSVSDCSKAISAISATIKAKNQQVNLENVWNYVKNPSQISHHMRLYNLTTISATGSEHNNVAVISKDFDQKLGMTSIHLYPVCSAVWINIQFDLPKYQKVNAFVDAQMHILEACFSSNDHSAYEVQFQYDILMCRTIKEIGDKIILQQTSNEEKLKLYQQFAWMADCALDGFCTAGNYRYRILHQLEHAVATSRAEVSHGAGLGVLMLGYIKTCQQTNERVSVMQEIDKLVFNGEGTMDSLWKNYKKMLEQWGHPTSLTQLLKQTPSQQDLQQFTNTFGLKIAQGFQGTKQEYMNEGMQIMKNCL